MTPHTLAAVLDNLTRVQIGLYALEMIVVVVVSTTAFDAIHWMLHHFIHSPNRFLRSVGNLHQAHHDFFDAELQHHEQFTGRNLLLHVCPEVCTQLVVSSVFYAWMDPVPVLLTQVLFVGLFIGVLVLKGRDPNHRPPPAVVEAPGSLFVSPAYHALHHQNPDSYFSSYFQLFDKLVGTGCHLRGRRFTMTGARGAFGAPLQKLLEAEGAIVRTLAFGSDWNYDSVNPTTVNAELDAILRETDVLVLAHGSKIVDAMAANCTSFTALIERFRRTRTSQQLPEVWAVGSEIETHPAFGISSLVPYLESKRAFARHARGYSADARMLYRHIVPSAFSSQMGPGLMSGSQAAHIALFLIKRGFRYVPVTYTGFAFLGFFKFLLRLDLPTPALLRNP